MASIHACPKCKEEFDSKKGMRTHYALSHEGSLKTTVIECYRCGKKAERRKTVVENNDKTFCSKECKYDTKTKINCNECGQEFKVYKNKSQNRSHCSQECRNESYRNGRFFTCEVCEEEVYRPNSQAESFDKKFCSHKCQTKYYSGEKHYRYKEDKKEYTYSGGWTNAREKRLEKDNHKCQECGKQDNLHIHHIKPYISFEDKFKANRQDNLITLCCTCHMKHEKGGMELDCLK